MNFSPTQLDKSDVNIHAFAIAAVGILAFTFSTLVPSHLAYVSIAFCLFLGVLSFSKSARINKRIFYFFLCFILPFLLSIVSLPFSMISEMQRFDYSQLTIVGRLANIFIFFLLILSIHQFSNGKNRLLIFKWYQIGILILLLTALWHAISLYTGLVNWPFETRSNLHSAYGNDYSFSDRVTGIAREPSFFVMYVVDFIALSLIFFSGVKLKVIVVFASLIMILSLSPSGYIVLALCFFLSYFLSKAQRFTFSLLIKIVVMFFLFFLFALFMYETGNPFFEYFINRIINLDPNSSSRLFMLLGPFEWVKESSLNSFTLGHGIKSYSIIGTSYMLPSGENIHVTSNNMYVDVFWEAGLLGLAIMVLYLLFVFIKIFSAKRSDSQRFVMFFVFFDLILSALFRADYASLRFFIMLYLLFVLISYDIPLGRVKPV